jgi:hypothetical protein
MGNIIWVAPTTVGGAIDKSLLRFRFLWQAIPTALSSRAFPPIKTKTSQHAARATLAASIGELDQYLVDVGGMPRSLSKLVPIKQTQVGFSLGRLRRALALNNVSNSSVSPGLSHDTSDSSENKLESRAMCASATVGTGDDDLEAGNLKVAVDAWRRTGSEQ